MTDAKFNYTTLKTQNLSLATTLCASVFVEGPFDSSKWSDKLPLDGLGVDQALVVTSQNTHSLHNFLSTSSARCWGYFQG